MAAVVGSVPQSKPIELAKAASIFTRFAATAGTGSEGGAQHAKVAYLRLASSAFDELVRLQGDVGVGEKEKKKRLRRSSNVDDLDVKVYRIKK